MLLSVVAAVILLIFPDISYARCKDGQLECGKDKCIPHGSKCDGSIDTKPTLLSSLALPIQFEFAQNAFSQENNVKKRLTACQAACKDHSDCVGDLKCFHHDNEAGIPPPECKDR
eukprot:44097_1